MNTFTHALRVAVATIIACFTIFVPAAFADAGSQVASVTTWMQNASPVGWTSSTNRIVYNSRGANGFYNAYSANPDGSGIQCLTCTIPSLGSFGTTTNRGASDVSPNGQYFLATVATSNGYGAPNLTAPGNGAANNIWLYSVDGTHAWQLTNIYGNGPTQGLAVIWPRFDRTGTEIVWASCYSPAIGNLGYWQLKVANIVWTSGVPSLANVRTIQPVANAFYEPYGFTPDDQHVIFATSAGQTSWINDQIDTVALDGTGLTQLTQMTAQQPNYNEFAFYTPDGNHIIYGGTRDATSGGMDYWEMNPDGTAPHRLTYFNERWSTEGMGYSDVESLAFNPNNPNQFVAAVSPNITSTNVNAEMVTLTPNPAGLTGQYYSGVNFGQQLATDTSNPSDSFYWDSGPAPGVPAANNSARWIGTVTPPVSGTYSFCIVANPSGQLYVGGQELINASWSYGANDCAQVSETAGVPVPIEFDFEHTVGYAYGQLSWILPGSSTETVIPGADLAPATAGAAASVPADVQTLAGGTTGDAGDPGTGTDPTGAGTVVGSTTGSGSGSGSGSGAGAGSGSGPAASAGSAPASGTHQATSGKPVKRAKRGRKGTRRPAQATIASARGHHHATAARR